MNMCDLSSICTRHPRDKPGRPKAQDDRCCSRSERKETTTGFEQLALGILSCYTHMWIKYYTYMFRICHGQLWQETWLGKCKKHLIRMISFIKTLLHYFTSCWEIGWVSGEKTQLLYLTAGHWAHLWNKFLPHPQDACWETEWFLNVFCFIVESPTGERFQSQ